VGRGEIEVRLEDENRSFAWGNEGSKVHTGNFTYYLRFKASRRLNGSRVQRALDVGFAGRVETPSENKQVTWADKLFTDVEWETFPMMSVSGKTYSNGEETVSPTLQVKVLQPRPTEPTPEPPR